MSLHEEAKRSVLKTGKEETEKTDLNKNSNFYNNNNNNNNTNRRNNNNNNNNNHNNNRHIKIVPAADNEIGYIPVFPGCEEVYTNENVSLVIEAINYLQLKNEERYLENVAEHCRKMYSWDIETVDASINRAIETGHVIKKSLNSKPYLRVVPGTRFADSDCMVFGSVKYTASNVGVDHVTMGDFQDFKDDMMAIIESMTSYASTADTRMKRTRSNSTSPRELSSSSRELSASREFSPRELSLSGENGRYVLKYVECLKSRVRALEKCNEFERRLLEGQQTLISRQQRMLEMCCMQQQQIQQQQRQQQHQRHQQQHQQEQQQRQQELEEQQQQ